MVTSEERGQISMYDNAAVIKGYEHYVLHSQSCEIREQEKSLQGKRHCKV